MIRGRKLISEVLVLLSVISAIAVLVSSEPTTTRFGVGFLGLFSSLVVCLRHDNALGLIMILTSAILLPGILASKPEEIRNRQGSCLKARLPTAILYPIAAFTVGLVMHLEYVFAGLLALAAIGLAIMNKRKRSRKAIFGLIVISQAVLVAASLRDAPVWLIVSSESCRLLCISGVAIRDRPP